MIFSARNLLFSAIFALAASPSIGFASPRPCLSSDILLQVIKVAYEKNDLEKGAKASALSRVISKLSEDDKDQVSGVLVEALISMLSDENRTVNIYAAISLGAFGTRSEKALPALEEARLSFREIPSSSEISFDPVDGVHGISVVIEEIEKASNESKRRGRSN